jgi:oligopeptide transport system substrate-binding protein
MDQEAHMKIFPLVRGFILLAAALLWLTACQPNEEDASDSTEAAPPPQTESAFQVEQTTSINRNLLLDPAKTEDPDSFTVSQNLYEGLVALDAAGQIQPGIAFSWVISDDQLDYIFEIRQNAAFSDGAPITTIAIEENFNRWLDPQSPLRGDGKYPTWLKLFLAFHGEKGADGRELSQVDGVQVVDNNAFIIHLNRVEPNLLAYLAEPAFAILSPAALSANPAYGTRQSTIVSSGAYVITSWTDEGMTLSPNPQYWNSAERQKINYIWK